MKLCLEMWSCYNKNLKQIAFDLELEGKQKAEEP